MWDKVVIENTVAKRLERASDRRGRRTASNGGMKAGKSEPFTHETSASGF